MSNIIIDSLLFRAKLTPNAVAIHSDDLQITYISLLYLVKKIAYRFRSLGLCPNQLVITSISSKWLDWLVTLALIHEGCISCSNHGYSKLDLSFEFDWLISDRVSDNNINFIFVNNNWLEEIQNQSNIQINQYQLSSQDEVIRLVLTSGTQGIKKAVGISMRQFEGRFIQRIIAFSKYGLDINLLPISTIGGINSAISSILMGIPLVCISNFSALVHIIDKRKIGMLSASPIQLANFIQFLEKNNIKLANKLQSVISGGGVTSSILLEKIHKNLSKNFLNYYGSTEAGGVCIYAPSVGQDMHLGYPFPQVIVEIVNEELEPVSYNVEGALRVKTPYMVNTYFRNELASSHSFKDGWFYPGDIAKKMADGSLVMIGRDSEIINRGGAKIDILSLESFIIQSNLVKDAVVFDFTNEMGIQDLALAVVYELDLDASDLKERIKLKFGASNVPSRIIRVKEVPRNVMGKIEKYKLRAIVS